jgi:hypothetical protein
MLADALLPFHDEDKEFSFTMLLENNLGNSFCFSSFVQLYEEHMEVFFQESTLNNTNSLRIHPIKLQALQSHRDCQLFGRDRWGRSLRCNKSQSQREERNAASSLG